jgi:hypothetical protein
LGREKILVRYHNCIIVRLDSKWQCKIRDANTEIETYLFLVTVVHEGKMHAYIVAKR